MDCDVNIFCRAWLLAVGSAESPAGSDFSRSISIVTRLSPEDREALSSDENVETILAESWDDMNVKYNGEAEYTKNVDVRKALS